VQREMQAGWLPGLQAEQGFHTCGPRSRACTLRSRLAFHVGCMLPGRRLADASSLVWIDGRGCRGHRDGTGRPAGCIACGPPGKRSPSAGSRRQTRPARQATPAPRLSSPKTLEIADAGDTVPAGRRRRRPHSGHRAFWVPGILRDGPTGQDGSLDMKSLNGVAVIAAWSALAAGGAAHAQEAVQWRVEDGGNGHWYARISHAIDLN
jgi:hypothetical protein